MEQKTTKQCRSKLCITCDETKSTTFFRRCQLVCKECELTGVDYDKICRECEQEKSVKLFRINRKLCIECEQSSGRNYRKNTTKAAEWVENNRDRMSELQHNYYETNKQKIRTNESERLKDDPEFRMIKSYRKTISSLLHGKSSFNKRLNINYEHYVLWMKFRFNEDMNMANYVELWQIDHVLPLDIIKTKNIGDVELDENLECIFLWFNTMPVLCSHNMKKNKYLDLEQLSNHITMVELFMEKYNVPTDDVIIDTYKTIVQNFLDK